LRKYRKALIEESALYFADKINAPILLLHGELDPIVPVFESVKFFQRLRGFGRPSICDSTSAALTVGSDRPRRKRGATPRSRLSPSSPNTSKVDRYKPGEQPRSQIPRLGLGNRTM